jgi:hypothetical protein
MYSLLQNSYRFRFSNYIVFPVYSSRAFWFWNRSNHFRNFSNAFSNWMLLKQLLMLSNVGCVEVFLEKFNLGRQSLHVVRLLWNSKFITTFAIIHHWSSFINLIHTITFSFIHTLILSSHLRLRIVSGLFLSRFPKIRVILDAFLILFGTTCPAPGPSHPQRQAGRPSFPRRTRHHGFMMESQIDPPPHLPPLHFAL